MFRLRNNIWKKRIAIMLCVTMFFGQSSALSVWAVGELPILARGRIVEFLALSPDSKVVEQGTKEVALPFPSTIEALAEAELKGSPSDADEENGVVQVRIPVENWVCETMYDGELPGDYVFAPEFSERYELNGAAAPKFTITVEPKKGKGHVRVTGFAQLEDSVRQQWVEPQTSLEDLNLPETLEAYGYDMGDEGITIATPSQGDGSSESEKTITMDRVTWEVDPNHKENGGIHEYNGKIVGKTYCFTPVLPQRYVLKDGVSLPEIHITVGMKLRAAVGTSVGDFTIEGGKLNTDYSYRSNTLTIKTGVPLTITMAPGKSTTSKTIEVGTGSKLEANITLNNVNINATSKSAFTIKSSATANLTLSGQNQLNSTSGAGIQVDSRSGGLIITKESDGSSLTATGMADSAGIGGDGGSAGPITINGGVIEATGGENGAGIGGGRYGNGGKTNITGGTITAQGGTNGAGIGGGYRGNGGIINISGGVVTATGGTAENEFDEGGAGIGGGNSNSSGMYGSGGTITISGGTVTAIGANLGSGIGGGGYSTSGSGSGGDIIISGGQITAYSNGDGKGIGDLGKGYKKPDSSFSTGASGHAWIYTPSIGVDNDLDPWKGVFFLGNAPGNVYGSQVIDSNREITLGQELIIMAGASLTIDVNMVLTNNGTIRNNGTCINNGTVDNKNGIVHDFGVWEGTKPVGGTYIGPATGRQFTEDGLTIIGPTDDSISYHESIGFTFSKPGDYTITGTWTGSLDTSGGTAARSVIQIKEGIQANITCTDVNISAVMPKTGAFSVMGDAAVSLNLQGDNVFKSGEDCPGLSVPEKASLNITSDLNAGTGSLTAIGGANAAGIGGANGATAGTIVVEGGRITANGGDNASGIGGGVGGGAGSFATGTEGDKIWIVAGSISDKSNQSNWRGIIFSENRGSVYGDYTLTMDAEIPSGQVFTIPSGSTLTIPSGVTLKNNGILINEGSVINEGSIDNENGVIDKYALGSSWIGTVPATGIVNEAEPIAKVESNGLTVQGTVADSVELVSGTIMLKKTGDYLIYGEWTGAETIKTAVEANGNIEANVVLNGVKIINEKRFKNRAFALSGGAVMNLTLKGSNILRSGDDGTALAVPEDCELVITKESTGSLTADGGTGIGGNSSDSNGNSGKITIDGGTITVTSSSGAGIGGGAGGFENKNAGGIIINGGDVKATGGSYSAGIGSGASGASGGIIMINGGKIWAKGGAEGGAGVGDGNGQISRPVEKSAIMITGGEVHAFGSNGGAGIGGGVFSQQGNVKISGGKIIATGSEGGAGIGSGKGASSDSGGYDVEISGGMVTAVGEAGAFGIGNGNGNRIPAVFSTTDTGHAFIITDGISDNSDGKKANWKGTIFGEDGDKTVGQTYGDQTVFDGMNIMQGANLTVLKDASLTIPSDLTWSNKGTVINNGTITNNGKVNNETGIITSYGFWGGSRPDPLGTFRTISASAITFSVKGGTADITHATYGDTIVIEAKAKQPAASGRSRSVAAAADTVDFYLGTEEAGVLLGTGAVTTADAVASASIEVALTAVASGLIPKSEPYTITAAFRGTSGLFPSKTQKELTVDRRPITLTLEADPVFARAESDVTLTTKVEGAISEKAPSGTLTFRYGDTVIAEGIQIENKENILQAQTIWKKVPHGDYKLTAEYIPSADDCYQSKESAFIERYHITPQSVSAITFSVKNGAADVTHGTYGETIIIEAKAKQQIASGQLRSASSSSSAAADTISFYLGGKDTGVLLGTGTVTTADGVSSFAIEVALTAANGFIPKAESYVITAVFDGTMELSPSETQKSLIVDRRLLSLTLEADPPSAAYESDVTLTTKISGSIDEKAPNGTVTFRHGETVIAEGVAIENKGGTFQAQTVWKQVPDGDYSLTAEYIPSINDRYQGKEKAVLDGYHVAPYPPEGENPGRTLSRGGLYYINMPTNSTSIIFSRSTVDRLVSENATVLIRGLHFSISFDSIAWNAVAAAADGDVRVNIPMDIAGVPEEGLKVSGLPTYNITLNYGKDNGTLTSREVNFGIGRATITKN